MQLRHSKILEGILKNKRIANAYIFTCGDASIKLEAAKKFAKDINCINQNPLCNECENCQKINKNSHPDVITIEKSGASIKINQIRVLKDLTKYGPNSGIWQVIIIKDADTMTKDAANSFLKLLEEPPDRVVFILISEKEGLLPKTILSRCQKIIFGEQKDISQSPEAADLMSKLKETKINYVEISQLLSEKKNLKEILQELFTLYAIAQKARKARVILETLKGIEKNANFKLAIDFLCFKLWNIN